MKENKYEVEVGADVSKKTLRIDIQGKQKDIKNSKSDITSWLKSLKKKHPSLRVTCESTGGYENTLIAACLKLAIPISQVNPVQVKNFIRSFGNKAKTDPIDAHYIARFATERTPSTLDKSWLKTHKRAELLLRIDFLKSENTRRKGTLDKYDNTFITADIKREIVATEKKIERYEKKLQDLINEDEKLKKIQTVLEEVSGVGFVTSSVLINTLPELGQVSRGQVAGLVGIAPLHQDSGTMKGKRKIHGGRSRPRRALYMACISAITHNPVIKAAYESLKAAGKPHNVAMIAVSRKLLIHLNSLVKKEIYEI